MSGFNLQGKEIHFAWDDASTMAKWTNEKGKEIESMLGPDKAIILNFIEWSILYKQADHNEQIKKKYYLNGHWWMQDSYAAWQHRMPWLTPRTIRRYLDELVEAGFLEKRSANSCSGRIPNFYRRLEKVKKDEPSVQKSEESPVSKMDTPSVQNGHSPVSKMDDGTYSCNHALNHTYESGAAAAAVTTPQKLKSTEWPEDDKFAAVYGNICKIPAGKRRFSRERTRIWLEDLMTAENKTKDDLIRISTKWAAYYQTPGSTVKNALASLGNWIRNDFGDNRKGSNGATQRSFAGVKTEKRYEAEPISEDFMRRINTYPTPK